MKARLINMNGDFIGSIPDEATYEGVKSGRLEFKRPLEEIPRFLVSGQVFLRLMAMDKETPWISVKDKLPERGQRCICVFMSESTPPLVCENTYAGDGKWYDDEGEHRKACCRTRS